MHFFEFISVNSLEILNLIVDHLALTAIAVCFAILIGVPLGILTSYIKPLNKPVMGLANVIQAIPSIALLGIMIPIFGIGAVPAVVAVTMYSLLPIIKNTNTGISSISPVTLETAKGIGLTGSQRLFRIQIPQALPIIMAGVRISAVTAVGLVTMAAYIGAGGLGKLVVSGISSMNMTKILAGAIPACILALIIDYTFSLVEKLVVPKGLVLEKYKNKSKKQQKTQRNIQRVALATMGVFLCVVIILPIALRPNYDISIGTKSATEPEILNFLYAEYIEDQTDLEVERKTGLGDTQTLYSAFKGGQIDMVLGYSGTVYVDVIKQVLGDKNPTLEEMKEKIDEIFCPAKIDNKYGGYNCKRFDTLAFNNTYTMAVKRSFAEKYNLKTTKDLALLSTKNSGLKLACTNMFNDRADGWSGLKKTYGFIVSPNNVKVIDGALRYEALANEEVDFIEAYSTDGLIAKYDLVALEDNLDFFPKYNIMPFINNNVLKEYPQLKCINDLAPYLTEELICKANYQVDVEQRSAKAVAREYLKIIKEQMKKDGVI